MRGAWAAFLPALFLAPMARASYDGGPGYPLSLPQTLRGTVAVPLDVEPVGLADTLAALYPVLAGCWRTPKGIDRTGHPQATARFALRRDGSLIGPPRITYGTGAAGRLRASLFRAAREAITLCTPARITPGLGRAIAGCPIALRFVLTRPD